MKYIQCTGKFDYTNHKVACIIKINKIDDDTYFDVGGYYPIIYNFSKKKYMLLDNVYNLALCPFEDRNIDEVFRYLSKFDGCIFEASYYIDYIVGQKRSNMGFKNSFNIEWELKTFINKMRSKNGITIY